MYPWVFRSLASETGLLIPVVAYIVLRILAEAADRSWTLLAQQVIWAIFLTFPGLRSNIARRGYLCHGR